MGGRRGERERELELVGRLISRHRQYLLYVYRWAARCGLVGSLAFCTCCLCRETIYPKAAVMLAPMWSAPLKRWLKRTGAFSSHEAKLAHMPHPILPMYHRHFLCSKGVAGSCFVEGSPTCGIFCSLL